MFVIESENLGVSLVTYATREEALTAARQAWKRNPARVGMCTIEEFCCIYGRDAVDCPCAYIGDLPEQAGA